MLELFKQALMTNFYAAKLDLLELRTAMTSCSSWPFSQKLFFVYFLGAAFHVV